MCDPEMVQQTLPPGLAVDTYEGMAWIGIVPFCMRRIRPTVLPFLSCEFLELNLRTYVRDRNGNSGVWFYSLDANHALAVWTARLFFGLPYRHAKMQVEGLNDQIRYSCQRRGSATVLEYQLRPSENIGEAKLGSLEFFLVERYRLFAFRRARLLTGRVYHSPYQRALFTRSRCNRVSCRGGALKGGKHPTPGGEPLCKSAVLQDCSRRLPRITHGVAMTQRF
jgi:uncharacterized protein YqjF (DUF2071 family)